MTFHLDWFNGHLTDDDCRRITIAALTVAQGLEKLSLSTEVHQPPLGTSAHRMLESPVNRRTTQGNTHLDNTFNLIASSSLAAADHIRTFAISVRSRRTSVANWTITRGAIEALGRANYLLDAGDASDLLARYVAVAHDEFRHAKHSEYVLRSGEPVDVRQYEADLDAYLADVGVAPLQPTSTTAMATQLLEATSPGSSGRKRYSQMSAAAHGQTPGLGMFRTADDAPLMFPRKLVLEAAHQQVGCAVNVGDKIAVTFTTPGPTRERWMTARRRSLEVIGQTTDI